MYSTTLPYIHKKEVLSKFTSSVNDIFAILQSIIEEEGGALPSNTDSNDHKNWDQPLIIAEPDVQVRIYKLAALLT